MFIIQATGLDYFGVRPGAQPRGENLKGAPLGLASALIINIRLGLEGLPGQLIQLIWPLRRQYTGTIS